MSAYPELDPLDPGDLQYYTIDWTTFLTALSDTISSVAWTLTGCTLDHATNDTLTATAWVKTGVLGSQALASCQITCASGAKYTRTITFQVRDL